jgi:hypothetical protein
MTNLIAAICPQCGAPLPLGARACPFCRVSFTQAVPGAPTSFPGIEPAELPPLPDGWTAYTNTWDGCCLGVPPGWRVVCSQGVVNVREDSTSLVSTTFQAVRLQAPMSASDFAQQWINTMRASLPDFTSTPAAGNDASQVSLNVQAHVLNTLLTGSYTLSCSGQDAFISGYQCPQERAASLEDTFHTVQSSYRPLEKIARQIHQEPSENAFNVWIPSGWQVKSGVNRSNPGGGAFISLDVTRDTAALVRASVPWVIWSFTEGLPGMWAAPGQVQSQAYMPAAQLCQAVILPWLSTYHQQLQLVEVIDRPDLLPYMANQFTAAGVNPQMLDLSAAMLVTSYVENSTTIQQVSRIMVQHPRNPMPFSNPMMSGSAWYAFMDSFYRAPQDEFTAVEPVLAGILDSVAVNPAWQQSQVRMNNSFMTGPQNNSFWPG